MKILALIFALTSVPIYAGISVEITYGMTSEGTLSNCMEMCVVPDEDTITGMMWPYPADSSTGTIYDPPCAPPNIWPFYIGLSAWNFHAVIINTTTGARVPVAFKYDADLILNYEDNL